MKPHLFLLALLLNTSLAYGNDFYSTITPLPPAIKQQVQQYTWHPGCPVALDDLVFVKLTYWGFDQKSHLGELIIKKQRAAEIVKIFAQLYTEKFPIQSMKPMYYYQGNDELSMESNNTSAFNCRLMTGTAHQFSQHSFGTAIDINPLINPYVKGSVTLPNTATSYLNRTITQPGMITPSSQIYQLFKKAGWHWGGNWHSLKDYQHFEKPF